MSVTHQIRARLGLAATLWCIAWSCLVISLTQSDEPWPWGGLSIFIAVAAMTATLWATVGMAAERAIACITREVDEVRREVDTMPEQIAEGVARALSLRRIGGG